MATTGMRPNATRLHQMVFGGFVDSGNHHRVIDRAMTDRRAQPPGATRPWSYVKDMPGEWEQKQAARLAKHGSELAKHDARFDAPVQELREAISDGNWWRKYRADRIARKHKVRVQRLIDRAGVAVSDSGYWICLPDRNTPENAPDEIDTESPPDAS